MPIIVRFGVSFLAYLDFEAYWRYSRRPTMDEVSVDSEMGVLVNAYRFF